MFFILDVHIPLLILIFNGDTYSLSSYFPKAYESYFSNDNGIDYLFTTSLRLVIVC